jgi:hypothetical protein
MLLPILLHSCADIPNVPICTELEPDSAYCVNILEEKGFYWNNEILINDKTYWQMRPACVRVPPKSWAALKSYILKNCKNQGGCKEFKNVVNVIESKNLELQK